MNEIKTPEEDQSDPGVTDRRENMTKNHTRTDKNQTEGNNPHTEVQEHSEGIELFQSMHQNCGVPHCPFKKRRKTF